MEDPVKVDIWGQVRKGFTEEAVKFVREYRLFLSELEVRKQVNQSVVKGERILVVEKVDWKTVQQIYCDSPQWLFGILLLQEDYLPQDFEPLSNCKNYCSIHHFYFGGSLGCHVCNCFIID